jgi:lysyl endopeptidase
MNRMTHHWLVSLVALGLVLVLAIPTTAAPAAIGSAPPDGLPAAAQPLSEVEVITMPPVDVKALLAEDQERFEAGLPVSRFAFPFEVDYTPADVGTWEPLAGDLLLWRLRIASPGALSLNLGFTRYSMPSGGQLSLYTPDRREVVGPFTEADNEVHGQLWTPILLGDEIVVELALPAASLPGLELELGFINHGYVEFGVPRFPESGACNLDVVCGADDGYPQVDPWRDQIRSAGPFTKNGVDTCSGALINNTAQDLTPYYLTADHCGITPGNAPTVVVYWNYENSWCRPVDDPINGQPGDGQRTQFNSGAFFIAGYDPSDFTLIELDDPVNPDFNPHWAGWDRRDIAPASAVTIHHPGVEEKRISFEDDPTSITDYLSDTPDPNGTHIRIADWDLGTTEPGSSGSPLFSPEHRIIGDLTGGYAACYNDEPDWYGRLHVSWTGGGSPSTRLSDWLDPLNSGVEFLDGRDVVETSYNLEVTPPSLEICAPVDASYDITVTQEVPGYVDPVTLSTRSEPTGTIVLFSTNPVIPTGTSVLTITNTAAAPTGSYDVDIIGTAATQTLTVTVGLNLYAGLPDQPALISPPDGAVDQPLTPPFEWNDIPSASSYDFQLDPNPLFAAPLIVANDLPDPSYVPDSPLDGGRCYWWQVQGNNACGTGTWTEPFHFATAQLAASFFDDIESGDGLWSHQAAQGTDNWAISTAQSHSPTHAWYVPDDPVVTDSFLWNTDPVAVGGGSTLTFWHRHQFESSYDGAVLEISTDGGGSWTDLGPYIAANGYNGSISTCCSNPLGGRQAWVSDQTTWTQVEVDLSSFAGEDVQIRWRIGCDYSVSDVGWYIDDVQITSPLPPNPAPTLLGITPDAGSAYVDTPVQIEGSGFLATPSVKLGDTWLLSVTLVSSSTLDAVVPAGMPGGVYDLTLYNGDCQEATLADAYTVIVQCISPTVSLESDSPVVLGEPVHFTATLDAGTPPLTYTWDFGGAGSGSGGDSATPVFTHTEAGSFTAVVTVENECGVDTASTSVEVAPVCTEVADVALSLVAPGPAYAGEPVELLADIMPDDAAMPYSYTMDCGDGTIPVTGTESLDPLVLSHTYAASGTYTVEIGVWNCALADPVTSTLEIGVETRLMHYIYLPLVVKDGTP